MIESLSHITFIVKDPDRTAELMRNLFDAEEVFSREPKGTTGSAEKFLMIGDVWIALIKGDSLPERTYNHVAFKIQEAEFDHYADRIRSLGLETLDDRTRVEGEGRSLYFYDYDNHLFELHTGTLEDRLTFYHQKTSESS